MTTEMTKQTPETVRYLSIKAALEQNKASMAEVIPSHLSPERLLSLALLSIRKTPKLQECAVSTLLGCVVESSRLGLELGGSLGQAYLIPYTVKGVPTVQMIIGYRGYVELMRRGGQVSTIRAVVVHQKDHFELREGLEQVIDHRPYLQGDAGPMKFVYAVAKFARSGDYQAVFLTKAEVDAVRSRSRASADGPWVTDYEEMAKKTAVRRLAKLMPLSVEAAEAIEQDDERSYDIESTAVEVASEVSTQAPAAKARMAAKRERPLTIQNGDTTQRPFETEEYVPSEPPPDVVLPTVTP